MISQLETLDKLLRMGLAGRLEDKLNHNASGVTQVALKSGDTFLVADDRGDFHPAKQEMGLFWHGTRFLRTCNVSLHECSLIMLSHHISNTGGACQFDLTNTPFTAAPNGYITHSEIHVCRQLELQNDQLFQTLIVTSFHADPVSLTLSMDIGADF